MKHFLVLAAMAGILASANAQIRDSQVVGTWHYDMKSARFELDPKLKAQLAKSTPEEKAQAKQIISNMTAMVGNVSINFAANHKVTVTMKGQGGNVTGKWSLKGRKLIMAMDRAGAPSPDMNFDPSGKKINVAYANPQFGTAHLVLVK